MKKELMIVDGYNMIGAWPELVKLKNQDEMEEARDQLLHQLSNYQRYEGIEILVVFDAQFVPGIQTSFQKYLVTVIFTKEGETADSYIERIVEEKNNRLTQVTVATSDMAEQWLVFSKGALRKSANELYRDLKRAKQAIKAETVSFHSKTMRRNTPWDSQQLTTLEELRENLSKKE
ncbi:DNA-binding protein [Carnobacterium divergens]|uniref:Ribonuclease n=2 Tax=Carnobacterium divergens TaxID=2748 RepID=A0A0R2HWH2_CARDV|nr:NYN domain-containing protein [Carnobacterium divergens]ANZ98965.1 DNA-binding protein [Carnobacterium divergens]KRN56888.1 ribonuclease [Carnobacterium divergens DSM 20623]MDO0874889.1 NYN domain-containing protein [Carnobacterium divergens]MDT1958514.1 NYN domain-containing protein [Carnobacterium divergens]MDT1974482.1 NYN domain-containing protein [Carnobacterium divergens]